MREFGLIGYPLGHSFSKAYFTGRFEREGVDAKYSNFAIQDPGILRELLSSHPLIEGLNVTIPHKERVLPLLDTVDPLALRIGAVNVIRVERGSSGIKLHGYNTDIYGFTESIKPLLRASDNLALVLGAGGSSRAVRVALELIGIEVKIVSREPGRGDITYGEIDRNLSERTAIIVNTTPAGMYPAVDGFPPFPYQELRSGQLLYDLVYNPEITRFMSFGLEAGCRVKGGLEMLHLQADRAWSIWNSVS